MSQLIQPWRGSRMDRIPLQDQDRGPDWPRELPSPWEPRPLNKLPALTTSTPSSPFTLQLTITWSAPPNFLPHTTKIAVTTAINILCIVKSNSHIPSLTSANDLSAAIEPTLSLSISFSESQRRYPVAWLPSSHCPMLRCPHTYFLATQCQPCSGTGQQDTQGE